MADKKIYVVPEYKEVNHSQKKPSGSRWCPYCGTWSIFQKPKRSDLAYLRCPECGISTEDFWVKMVNNDWGMEEAKKRGRKKK